MKIISDIKRRIPFDVPTMIALVIGVFLRVVEFIQNRSLWADEARVANQILSFRFSDIFRPLNVDLGYSQGFMFVEYLSVKMFGPGEYALRLFPLLCGIASLILFAVVVQKFLTRPGSFIAILLFALAFELIYFSSEVKPYALDILVAVIVLDFFVRAAQKDPFEIHPLRYALGGLTAVFFSTRAIFILLGCSLSLAVFYAARKETRKCLQIAKANLPWALVTVLYGLCAIKPFLHQHDLQSWDAVAFSTPKIFSLEFLRWLIYDLVYELTFFLRYNWALTTVCFTLGFIAFWQSEKRLFSVLGGPIFLVVLASFFGYPLYDRLVIFLAPALLIIIVKGFSEICAIAPGRLKKIFLVLCFLLLVDKSFYFTRQQFLSELGQQEIKPILNMIMQQKKEGDKILVSPSASAAFHYYRRFYPFDEADIIYQPRDTSPISGDLERIPENARLWCIFLGGTPEEKDVDNKALEASGGTFVARLKVRPLNNSTQYWSTGELLLYSF